MRLRLLQERQELKQRERQKRRSRMEAISTLTELGYNRRDAARALHLADGDVDRAYNVSLTCTHQCMCTCALSLTCASRLITVSADPAGLQSGLKLQQQPGGGSRSGEHPSGMPRSSVCLLVCLCVCWCVCSCVSGCFHVSVGVFHCVFVSLCRFFLCVSVCVCVSAAALPRLPEGLV